MSGILLDLMTPIIYAFLGSIAFVSPAIIGYTIYLWWEVKHV